MKSLSLSVSCGLALVLLAGCSDDAKTVVGVERQETFSPSGFASYDVAFRAQAPGGLATIDDLFLSATEFEPWFGGMYIADGQLRLVTTDLDVTGSSAFSLAVGLLETAGKRALARDIPEITLVRGHFSFRDLWNWRVVLSPRFQELGVRFLDIDEVNNVLDLRVASAEQIRGLEDWISENDVPAAAVRISQFHQPQLSHYDFGGDSVVVRWGPNDFFGCTLTQAVEHRLEDASLDTLLYGITNSHCTENFGVYDGNHLVEANESTIVATEYWDHPLFSDSRCETFRGDTDEFCRYSDAALFKFNSSGTAGLNPHRVRPALDSLHAEETRLIVGDSVHMYGAVSSQENGVVYQTCVDLESWDDGNHLADLLCQFTASYDAQDGDSGAPIWIVEDSTYNLFSGIHWGSANDTSYFSGALRLGWEIQPDKVGWEGTICLSFDSAFCWY